MLGKKPPRSKIYSTLHAKCRVECSFKRGTSSYNLDLLIANNFIHRNRNRDPTRKEFQYANIRQFANIDSHII